MLHRTMVHAAHRHQPGPVPLRTLLVLAALLAAPFLALPAHAGGSDEPPF